MELSKEQIEKIESFLKSKSASKCPICHCEGIHINSGIYQLLSLNKEASFVTGENIQLTNLIMVSCTNCKHASLFSLEAILDSTVSLHSPL